MSEIISYRQVEEKVLTIRGQSVILDRDVAELYGVETKRVNEAVTHNPDKFPEGYIIELTKDDYESLRSKISTLNVPVGRGKHTKYTPKAFTEKGLYMLATILKSPAAAQTTIAIVETFAKIRELSRTVSQLSDTQERTQQKSRLLLTAPVFSFHFRLS
ncbi:MAG: ORF6N domain-containing protein [Synergistaceae bacterium]|jgi:hypothetical protein|nr:ORF6N domain-containing protein [Synergistaceae bacterium]